MTGRHRRGFWYRLRLFMESLGSLPMDTPEAQPEGETFEWSPRPASSHLGGQS